jgi:hypothetical protein
LTERLGLTEAGIKVFEETDSNKQQAATTRHGIMGMLPWYQEILKEKRSLSCQTSLLDSLKSSGTSALPPVLLDIGDTDPDDPPTVQEEALSP